MAEQVKPYNEQEGKKGQVSKMFNNIAPYYDFLNRLLSLRLDVGWRKKALNQLKDHPPQTLLDVATGTADVAIAASKQLKPQKIIGVDISTQMLEVGRQKVARKNLSHVITLQEGDSENLPFADNTFDAVTVAFGVRNYEDLHKGMREMRRVLRPGGKLVVLEFSQPALFPFKQLYLFYFKYILPAIGRFTSKDPKAYQYLYESVQAFPNGQDFVGVMEETGYQYNKCVPLTLGICSIYTGSK